MHALRFLANDRWDPISGVRWSDAWVEPEHGVIAYPADALPHWIGSQLWHVELAGDLTVRELSVRADRGRLIAPIDRWDERACHDFVQWCRERYPDVGTDPNNTAPEAGCTAGYEATQLAGLAAVDAGRSYTEGETAERERQIAWMRRRAALDD